MHILSARTQGHRQPTYAQKPVSIQLRCALAGRSQIEGLNRNRKSKVDGWADRHDYVLQEPKAMGEFSIISIKQQKRHLEPAVNISNNLTYGDDGDYVNNIFKAPPSLSLT